MPMTAREAFERGTRTFNDHDMEGFAEVLADEVAFSAPGGVRGAGKEACVAFFAGWYGAFPDARVDVRACHFIDDLAIEEGTFTGTQAGPLPSPMGDIPPTGRSVAVDYVHVLRFRDGKHVSFELLFDRLLMLEQLGIAPAAT